MNSTNLLKYNMDLIDAFVIHYENDFITQLWHSICEKGWFRNHGNFLTSVDKIESLMFESYTIFIEQLPIQTKIDYIHFYESQSGRTWKQLYIHNNDVKHFDNTTVFHCGTKWWENALADFHAN